MGDATNSNIEYDRGTAKFPAKPVLGTTDSANGAEVLPLRPRRCITLRSASKHPPHRQADSLSASLRVALAGSPAPTQRRYGQPLA